MYVCMYVCMHLYMSTFSHSYVLINEGSTVIGYVVVVSLPNNFFLMYSCTKIVVRRS